MNLGEREIKIKVKRIAQNEKHKETQGPEVIYGFTLSERNVERHEEALETSETSCLLCLMNKRGSIFFVNYLFRNCTGQLREKEKPVTEMAKPYQKDCHEL